MGILFGVFASIAIGCSDFLGRYGTKRSNAVTAVSGALVGGVGITTFALLFVPSVYTQKDIWIGALSGVVVGLALATLYEAMATASAAIAAPLAAVGTAVFPLAWDVIFSGMPSALVLGGVLVALAGLIVVMYSPGITTAFDRGIRIALVSMVLWGIAITLSGQSSDDSGVWMPVSQRVVALVVMVTLASSRSLPLLPSRRLFPIMIVSGVVGATGLIFFTLGTQRAALAPVAVAASMFPVVSTGLSAAFDDDVLHWWQGIGIATVIGGIAMMTLG